MNPCELNAAIAALTNHLYVTLPKRDFFCLSVFLSELSKSMFTMEVLRGVCFSDDLHKGGQAAVELEAEVEVEA